MKCIIFRAETALLCKFPPDKLLIIMIQLTATKDEKYLSISFARFDN